MNNEYLRFHPKEHIKEMLIRLNSNDRHIRQSAYFEVFCCNFFYNKGFKVDVHPSMENKKRPDFQAYNDKRSFYIEAAYFGDIRTLIPGLSGQHIGNIRTPCRANKLNAILKVLSFKGGQ